MAICNARFSVIHSEGHSGMSVNTSTSTSETSTMNVSVESDNARLIGRTLNNKSARAKGVRCSLNGIKTQNDKPLNVKTISFETVDTAEEDAVFLEEEEKLMQKHTDEMMMKTVNLTSPRDNEGLEKEMIAVAIMKSVVDSQINEHTDEKKEENISKTTKNIILSTINNGNIDNKVEHMPSNPDEHILRANKTKPHEINKSRVDTTNTKRASSLDIKVSIEKEGVAVGNNKPRIVIRKRRRDGSPIQNISNNDENNKKDLNPQKNMKTTAPTPKDNVPECIQSKDFINISTREANSILSTNSTKKRQIKNPILSKVTSQCPSYKSIRNTGLHNRNLLLKISHPVPNPVLNPVLPSTSYDEVKIKAENQGLVTNIEDRTKLEDETKLEAYTSNICNLPEDSKNLDTHVKENGSSCSTDHLKIALQKDLCSATQIEKGSKSKNLTDSSTIPSKSTDPVQTKKGGIIIDAKQSYVNTAANSVSFFVSKDCAGKPITGEKSNANTDVSVRNRIFSIDIDSGAFDYGVMTGSSSSIIQQPSDTFQGIGDLMHIASPEAGGENSTEEIKEQQNSEEIPLDLGDEEAELVVLPRDRGLSFELFAFGSHHGEPKVKIENENSISGRPRGDSIIFDPVSFTDGGIHEEAALQQSRRNSIDLGENVEMELMNDPGLAKDMTLIASERGADKVRSESGISQDLDLGQHLSSTMPLINPECPKSKMTISGSSNKFKKHAQGNEVELNHSSCPPEKVCGSKTGTCRNKYLNVNLSSNKKSDNSHPQCSSNDTIQMPQGSAAAAAAASPTAQILPSSLNGSICHTVCPMELLNKGGRIGIYLPDARKERIAKFHSKRKSRIWRKRIKYDCRKKLADSRPRIKGRFVKSLDDE